MRLRQVETFYWAARLGSLANAAKRLNATQSAVSMRIRELETQLGVVLFDRSQRSVRLTPHGLSLLPFAEQMIETAEKMAAFAKDDTISGYVRVGIAEIIAYTWLPHFLELLRSDFPHVQVELEIALSHVIEAKMLDGAIDMALTAFELPSSRFISADLGHVAFCWMNSPLMKDVPATIDPDYLSSLPVILTSREAQHRGSTMEWFTNNNVRFKMLTICNTFSTAAALAKVGLGIALLPVDVYRPDIEKDDLRILNCAPQIQPLKLYSLRPRHGTAPAHRAIEWAAATASSFEGKAILPRL